MCAGLASALLLWCGVAGVQAGPSAAGAFPGCPEDHPAGPCRWCPGDPVVQTPGPSREGDEPPPPPPLAGLICDPATLTNCHIETRA
jgi:hypothetical protein